MTLSSSARPSPGPAAGPPPWTRPTLAGPESSSCVGQGHAARRRSGAALLLAALASGGCAPDRSARSSLDASLDPPANFELDGNTFCYAGANNYYLIYKPKEMVDHVFESAKAMNLSVLRMWGFIDIGALDGSVKNVDPLGDGKKDGVYFQRWDPKLKRVIRNEGPDGLPHLDYALAKAAEAGVKVILVLTNNWHDFGGIDQYVAWFGRSKHHEFYTAPEIKDAYKDWVHSLVTRKNTVNGRLYRDDPTIFSWELANEPRCKGTGPGAEGWTNQTLVSWADEMSTYIKSLDPNHMVSVGDEGFLNRGGQHWTYQAYDGVDHEALTRLPNVDFGTFHMYPEHWGTEPGWDRRWIVDHLKVARQLGKPTVLEEYGLQVTRDPQDRIVRGLDQRLDRYTQWNDAMLTGGGNGTLVWMLAGIDVLSPNAFGYYEDHDRYTVYPGDETARLLADHADRFATSAVACRQGVPASGDPSPFVRVVRPPGPIASSAASPSAIR